jgi:hypothetical protein
MPLRSADGLAPMLDIGSYARNGPEARARLSQGEIELIHRTVRRAPEVMVKVLTRGGNSPKAFAAHLGSIGRDGEVVIETDDGRELKDAKAVSELAQDWDLDVEVRRSGTTLKARTGGTKPRLVHTMVFSMPAGTPPQKVLRAVRDFAREEFGAKHRYAMALHTDEPHPHVHLVVKAMSEEGRRLNIRKPTLRAWRQAYAEQLRRQGLSANATERAVRGEYAKGLRDGVYRTAERHESTHMAQRSRARSELTVVASQTRKEVEAGWEAVAARLAAEGHTDLAWYARRFIESMPPLRSEQEVRAESERAVKDPRVRMIERAR